MYFRLWRGVFARKNAEFVHFIEFLRFFVAIFVQNYLLTFSHNRVIINTSKGGIINEQKKKTLLSC